MDALLGRSDRGTARLFPSRSRQRKSPMAPPLTLHEDRALPADPGTRLVARRLYEQTRSLPLVCMHGHVEA